MANDLVHRHIVLASRQNMLVQIQSLHGGIAMPLLSGNERRQAEAIAAIGYCNPFLSERVELERRVLGRRFVEYGAVMHLPPGSDPLAPFPNVRLIRQTAEELAAQMRAKLTSGEAAAENELVLYEDLVLYVLYARHLSNIEILTKHENQAATQTAKVWAAFEKDYQLFFRLPGLQIPLRFQASHAFACFFQIQRAFSAIFDHILGRSKPIAELRAAVWETIFTHDMQRYARSLYREMSNVMTLILGPSGTGKELVASAIGRSQFVPFSVSKKAFDGVDDCRLHPVNLSALAPTLIESELFGHKKGAFTEAIADRAGRLAVCRKGATVFLDEIGELDAAIQVKLLRVLQERIFQRVGDVKDERFEGKIVAATNRDLVTEMRESRFREDFYYRLCADVIRTPSLFEQLADTTDDLEPLVRHTVGKMVKDDPAEADRLTGECVEVINHELGPAYRWPGNFRELEQCVRNIMIRGRYEPALHRSKPPINHDEAGFAQAVAQGLLTQKELIDRYTSLIYEQEKSYERTADRLGVDWRTVRKNLSEK